MQPVEDIDALPTSPRPASPIHHGLRSNIALSVLDMGLVGAQALLDAVAFPHDQDSSKAMHETGDTSILCPINSIQPTTHIFKPPGVFRGHL